MVRMRTVFVTEALCLLEAKRFLSGFFDNKGRVCPKVFFDLIIDRGPSGMIVC